MGSSESVGGLCSMSRSTVLRMIERIEAIADSVPNAGSIDRLTSLGSQFMGTAMAIKEELERHGISTRSQQMLDLTTSFDTSAGRIVKERWRVQAVMHQTAAYFRGLAERM